MSVVTAQKTISSCAGRKILATKTSDHAQNDADAQLAIDCRYDAFLFEALAFPNSKSLVSSLRMAGLDSIPTCHLDAGVDFDQIMRTLEQLDDFGTPMIKVAFPSLGNHDIDTVLDVLARKNDFNSAISVTPMRSELGRLLAALAGSALVFAPTFPEEGRIEVDRFARYLRAGCPPQKKLSRIE